jgi:hypothetical protein
MLKFQFDFAYKGREYAAECQPFPIDGTTELHITPHDPDLFQRFGLQILLRRADGSLATRLNPEPEVHEYLVAIAEGISANFDDQQKRINQ